MPQAYFSVMLLLIASGLVYASFESMYERERFRAAARDVRTKAERYRAAHCTDAPGTAATSLGVLSDTDVFPTAGDRIDPADGVFQWGYESGAAGAGILVIVGDAELRTRVRSAIGGRERPPNRVEVDIENRLTVMVPDFTVTTRGETGGAAGCL